MRFYLKGSLLFNLLLFAIISLLFFTSLGYGQKDKFVPLVILTPAMIMTLFCLLGEFFPKFLRRVNINLVSPGGGDAETESLFSKTGRLVGRKGFLIVTGWLFGFYLLAFLVGFLIAIPVAILLFLKVFANYGWFKSLTMTAATWAIIYVVFELLLRFELFRGILFGEIVVF